MGNSCDDEFDAGTNQTEAWPGSIILEFTQEPEREAGGGQYREVLNRQRSPALIHTNNPSFYLPANYISQWKRPGSGHISKGGESESGGRERKKGRKKKRVNERGSEGKGMQHASSQVPY